MCVSRCLKICKYMPLMLSLRSTCIEGYVACTNRPCSSVTPIVSGSSTTPGLTTPPSTRATLPTMTTVDAFGCKLVKEKEFIYRQSCRSVHRLKVTKCMGQCSGIGLRGECQAVGGLKTLIAKFICRVHTATSRMKKKFLYMSVIVTRPTACICPN